MATTTAPVPGMSVFTIEYTDRFAKPCRPELAQYIDFFRPRVSPEGKPYMAAVGVAYHHGEDVWSCHDTAKGGPALTMHGRRDVLAWGWRTFAPELAPEDVFTQEVMS